MIKPQEDALLTVREVAKKLRVHDLTVHRWIKQGSLEAVVLPSYGTWHQYRIKASVIQRFTGEGK